MQRKTLSIITCIIFLFIGSTAYAGQSITFADIDDVKAELLNMQEDFLELDASSTPALATAQLVVAEIVEVAQADNGTAGLLPSECLGNLFSIGVQIISIFQGLSNSSSGECAAISLVQDLTAVTVSIMDLNLCIATYSDPPDQAAIDQITGQIAFMNGVNVFLNFVKSLLGCSA